MLLEDKSVETGGVGIEKAMGMCGSHLSRASTAKNGFSNQFPFYLNSSVANSAYQDLVTDEPQPYHSHFPLERFQFQVLDMNLE